MLKRFRYFVRQYYLFIFALLAAIAGLILQLLHASLAVHWLLGVVAAIEVIPLLVGMLHDVRDGSYGIDILAGAAIISAIIFRQYWTAIVIVVMLTGGEALENYAEHRAETELDALLSRAPSHAHVIKRGQEQDVPVDRVRAGDTLSIRPGEVVPVDGVVLEGSTSFDESSLTGESLPQFKTVNDLVLSGSINTEGAITLKALRPAADSQYAQIIKLVRSARSSQAPFVRLADRYSIPFTVVAFAIAAVAWIVSGHSIRFLEVLVVATPCPLILAAPIAVISGMSRAAKQGIIIKTGSALERLAEAETVAFDKTGTLTTGSLQVATIILWNNFTKKEVLAAAASLEAHSNHVLARAIVEAAQKSRVEIPKTKKVVEIAGRGMRATIKSRPVLIGRAQLLQEEGIDMPKAATKGLVQSATFVAIGSQLAGTITFNDQLRPEAKATIKRLVASGIKHVLMITGDNAAAAKAVAKKIGIKEADVVADALPAEKLLQVEAAQHHPLVFVGDGVNDAPVLAASDVGIALGARGETAASESADMVIMLDDISKVAQVHSIARRTFSIAKQSILVGIALSIILMFVFSTGKFKPLYGAIIQEAVDVIVIFNALRAHSGKTA